jgi:hypothetical protein
MGASVRPDWFDYEGARAAGLTDAEIDAYITSQTGPRRSLAPAPPPSPAPEPPKAPFLSRLGDAAMGLGRAVRDDPVGTAKNIGAGVLRTGKDLGELLVNPTALRDWEAEKRGQPVREEMADFRPSGATALRAAEAGSLALPLAGRAAGFGARAVAGADIAANVGLGAAQTPDDPGVGAALGGLLGLVTNVGPLRGKVDAPSPVPDLPPQQGPRAPVRRAVPGPAPEPASRILAKLNQEGLTSDIAKIDASPNIRVEPPNPAPAPPSRRSFPDGFTTGQAYDDIVREARSGIEGDIARLFDTPNPNPAPRALEAFPDGFSTPEPTLKPKARAVPPMRDTPRQPVASAAPENVGTNALRADDLRGKTVQSDVANLSSSVEPPTATVANTATQPPVRTTSPDVGDPVPTRRPDLPPSTDGEVNWRTWLDPDAPGAKSVEARLREVATPEKVQAARGYESMQGTYARSLALAKDLVDDNGLQTIDAKKVRALVEQHGEAAIPALKKVATDNAKVMADAARVLNDPLASPADVLRASQVLESATRQTDELLGSIVTEQARAGRTLNALKIQAKLSSDPDLWMVHAKRALGDQPMTDDIMAQVRRLAREASEACG